MFYIGKELIILDGKRKDKTHIRRNQTICKYTKMKSHRAYNKTFDRWETVAYKIFKLDFECVINPDFTFCKSSYRNFYSYQLILSDRIPNNIEHVCKRCLKTFLKEEIGINYKNNPIVKFKNFNIFSKELGSLFKVSVQF